MNFSFLYHPLINYQKKLSDIFPDIDYSILIYLDHINKFNINYVSDNDENINIDSILDTTLNKLINSKWNYKWFNEDNLFESNKIQNLQQLSILDVSNHYLLLAIKLPSFNVDGNDFLIIKFNQYSLNYEITKNKKELSNDVKPFVGNFLYMSLKSIIDIEINNKQIFNSIKQQIEASSSNKSLRICLKRIISSIITNRYLSKGIVLEINISDDAIDKIAISGIDLQDIESEIDRIVTYKINVFNETIIIINANDFISFKEMLEEKEIDDIKLNYLSTVEVKKQKKAFDLLDSLEQGASKIKEGYIETKNDKLGKTRNPQAMTLERMANATFCTAPGVLYKIKEYKQEILVLFNKYPKKWKLLRTEFAPIYKLSMPNFLDKVQTKKNA